MDFDGKGVPVATKSDERALDREARLRATRVPVPSSAMLLSRRARSTTSRTRDALREARAIYRSRSGAEVVPHVAAEPPTPSKPVTPSRPATLARQAVRRLTPERSRPVPVTRGEPDVHLDVERLHVDRVDLKVDEINARVALQAHVLDLLRLDVGVNAELRGVALEIDGVDAQAELDVRLEHLTTIVDRVMSTIDRNPELLENLLGRLTATVDELGANAVRAVRGDLPDRSTAPSSSSADEEPDD